MQGSIPYFPGKKPVKPSVMPIYAPHWQCPSNDWGNAPGLSKTCVSLLEVDLPWSYGHHGEILFSFLPGRVRLASKCHLLEVVSTVNNMKDVGHLQREVGFVLQSICVCVRRLWDESMLELCYIWNFFWSIEGNLFNVYSTVVEFTRQTVLKKKKKEKDWK